MNKNHKKVGFVSKINPVIFLKDPGKTTILFLVITILILYPSLRSVFAAEKQLVFESLTSDDGLSQNGVQSIAQDDRGFIWIGTQDGLDKYDGYEFTVFTHDPMDSTSLSENYVQTLCKDRDGIVWIGTINGGLNRLDPATEEFRVFKNNPADSNSLSHNIVIAICEDHRGNLWVGTYGGGLNRMNRQTGKFTHYRHDPENPNSLSHDIVLSIYEDRQGFLWISTMGGGLNRFDQETGIFTHFKKDPSDSNSISSNRPWCIYESRAGELWVGSMNAGLNKLDRKTGKWTRYLHDPNNPNSLCNSVVQTIFEDDAGNLWLGTNQGIDIFDPEKEEFYHVVSAEEGSEPSSHDLIQKIFRDSGGVIWIATFGGGVQKHDPNRIKFKSYTHDPDNPNSLSHNYVIAIEEDPLNPNVLWIGTFGGGVDRFNRETGQHAHYHNDPNIPKSISENFIQSICFDRNGNMWVGTTGNGLNRFVRKTGEFIRYRHDPDDPESLGENRIQTLYVDEENTLWVGTYGNGLDKFNRQNGAFSHYRHDENDSLSLSHNIVKVLYRDRKDRFWVGTWGGGLNRFDPESGTFYRYDYNRGDSSSLNHSQVQSIHEDKKGILWIATNGGGLNRFNPETGVFTYFTVKDGLPHNSLYDILEDESGNLWISTNRGLSKFNPVSEKFRNYGTHDGLLSAEFNSGASCKSVTGEMFFGTNKGFNGFYPANIKDNPHQPPVVLTAFRKFNRDVKMDMPLSELRNLKLSYRDDVFSFEFAALDYSYPQKNSYAYMMEGFENEWTYSGTRRFVTYTNLDPGDYVFRVKGANSDGVWNESATAIQIKVIPPFWQTWWFTAINIALIGLFVMVVISRIKNRERKKAELDKKISDLKIAALSSQMKPHFVFNTINSIQYLISCNDQKAALEYLSKFSRLLRLTLENSLKSTIIVARELEFLNLYIELEQFRFDRKFEYDFQISPKIDCENVEIPVMCIQPIIENAILHGLRNRESGLLRMELEPDDNGLICIVRDNGIGINQTMQAKTGKIEEKSSLGMKITRERLELLSSGNGAEHVVEIRDIAESEKEQTGTEVKIRLPVY